MISLDGRLQIYGAATPLSKVKAKVSSRCRVCGKSAIFLALKIRIDLSSLEFGPIVLSSLLKQLHVLLQTVFILTAAHRNFAYAAIWPKDDEDA